MPEGGILNPAQYTYYQNITGFIHGDTQYYNISPLVEEPTVSWKAAANSFMHDFNVTVAAEQMDKWNWTASEMVSISIGERLKTDIAPEIENIAMINVCSISSISSSILIPG
jgi:transmembrane E3 ubiquitin-protein ligase